MDQFTITPAQSYLPQLDRAESLQLSDPMQALALVNEVQSLTEGASAADQMAQQHLVRCLVIRARCHVELANFVQAVSAGKRALELGEAIPYTPHLGMAYGLTGYADSRMGNYVDALRTFLQLQKKASENNDHSGVAAAYTGRALIYSFTGEMERSIASDYESLRIAQEVGDDFRQITQLNNLCWNHTRLGQPEKALAYGLQGLALSKGPLEAGIINLLHVNVGAAYLQLGDMANAKQQIAMGLAKARQNHDRYSEMNALLEYGRYHLAEKQPAQAVVCLEQSLKLAMAKSEKLCHYEAHKLIAQAYKALGDSHTALLHYEQFYTIRESVLNQQNQVRLATLEFEHKLDLALHKAGLSQREAANLEGQVQARTMDLQAALERETELSHKLEQALERESELQELKTASHEFRTPLSIIDLTTALLCKRIDKLTKNELDTYRERISNQIFYLKDMIQDVLTVNTSTSIQPIYTSYSIATFCLHLQNNLATELQGFDRVSIHCKTCNHMLHTDLDLVQRVVFNLITNAIKFSATSSPIELIIEPDDMTTSINIRVKDFGIGIPQTDLPHIFAMFYRAGNISTQSGLGLGLSVVHKIVSALQGAVIVESTVLNQGTTFCVTLPLRPPS